MKKYLLIFGFCAIFLLPAAGAQAATPAWYQAVPLWASYSGYPAPQSCVQAYQGPNSRGPDCYWGPVFLAASAESGTNTTYSLLKSTCTAGVYGCVGARSVYTVSASTVYTVASAPVQLDWSCLPQQVVSFNVVPTVEYDWQGNPTYPGAYWVAVTLTFSGVSSIAASAGPSVSTGGAAYGSVTVYPTVSTNYTVSCGSYSTTIPVVVVPSFDTPLAASLPLDEEVLYGTTPTIAYNVQHVRSGGTCTLSGTGVSQTFTQPASALGFTGADQLWTAPAGATSVTAKLWGAGGSSFTNVGSVTKPTGGGGFTIAQIPVTGGEQLRVIVGGGGAFKVVSNAYGGGGASHVATYGGNGGGRSAIRNAGGTELATAGGGGGGDVTHGGAGGGGLTGGTSNTMKMANATQGGCTYAGETQVLGATQTAGGTPADGISGTTGTQYQGGNGRICIYQGTKQRTAGGGGGYWGGGGSALQSGGSGGSGFCHPSLPFCVTVGAPNTGVPSSSTDVDFPGANYGYGILNAAGKPGYAVLMSNFAGSVTAPAVTSPRTYTLSCTAAGVTRSDTVTYTLPACQNGSGYQGGCTACNAGFTLAGGICTDPCPTAIESSSGSNWEGLVLAPGATRKVTQQGRNSCLTNYSAQTMFIPAKTAAELTAFFNRAPAINVTVF